MAWHSTAKKALRLIRDILIAFGLYFGGSLWFTLVWPRMGAVIGAFMVLFSAGVAAKINVKPFSDFSPLATYRTYFPSDLQPSENRRVRWACYRLGVILSLIPWLCYLLVLAIVKEGEKMQGHVVFTMILYLAGMFFLLRGGWLSIRNSFDKLFGKR